MHPRPSPREEPDDDVECMLELAPVLTGVDAQDAAVVDQLARSGTEDRAVLGEVVEQHDAIGDEERVVVRSWK